MFYQHGVAWSGRVGYFIADFRVVGLLAPMSHL